MMIEHPAQLILHYRFLFSIYIFYDLLKLISHKLSSQSYYVDIRYGTLIQIFRFIEKRNGNYIYDFSIKRKKNKKNDVE